MNASRKKVILKKRGRPATGNDPIMSLRMPKELTAAVDSWAARQADDPPRSEAFRRLLELGIAASASARPHSLKARAKAADLAAATIDRHTDQSVSPEEQARRKRRLLKGPKEFRGLRRDHPNAEE